MVDSARRLGDVVDERAGGAAEPVVEVDAGGEREQALQDAGAQVVQGASAVAFEGEQVLGGPVDRLDALTQRRDVRGVVGFIGSGGADQGGTQRGDGGGELPAGVALVAITVSPPRSVPGSSSSATSRSGRSAPTSRMARGVPSRPNAVCRRIPKKKRLW